MRSLLVRLEHAEDAFRQGEQRMLADLWADDILVILRLIRALDEDPAMGLHANRETVAAFAAVLRETK